MGLVDWLGKIAPVVVAIEEDLGLDALKSTVPGIGVLVGVAKWAQKKGAIPKAMKELCEKHGIVAEEVSSLDELKERVPESEVDLVLSRLKAEADCPTLVHYLKESHQVTQDTLNDLLDGFRYLQEALRTYSLLQPAEAVLEDPPGHPDYATPSFFRKTGPVAADLALKNRKVAVGREVRDVIKALEERGGVLLDGLAASGKTVVARMAAYQWLRRERRFGSLS